MHIGTVRLEEAAALDSMAGPHARGLFHFEVYWHPGKGWRWQQVGAAGLPIADPSKPFASSRGAYYGALESIGVEI